MRYPLVRFKRASRRRHEDCPCRRNIRRHHQRAGTLTPYQLAHSNRLSAANGSQPVFAHAPMLPGIGALVRKASVTHNQACATAACCIQERLRCHADGPAVAGRGALYAAGNRLALQKYRVGHGTI